MSTIQRSILFCFFILCLLSNCTPPPTPKIDEINIAKVTIQPGEKLSISARVTGITPLTYRWNATGGTFQNETDNPTAYTAPVQPGEYKIMVEVIDKNGVSATYDKDILVVDEALDSVAITTLTPTTAAPTATPTPTPTPTSTVEATATEPLPVDCQEFDFEGTQPLCWHTRYYDGKRFGGALTQNSDVLEFPVDFSLLPVDPATPNLRKGMIEFTTEPEAGLPEVCPKKPLTDIPFGTRFVAEISIPPELQGAAMEWFVQTAGNYKWYASRPVKEIRHSGDYLLESGQTWVRLIDGEEVVSEWDDDPVLKYGIEFNVDADQVKAQSFVIRIDNIKVCSPIN